jgi:hypothetical protein
MTGERGSDWRECMAESATWNVCRSYGIRDQCADGQVNRVDQQCAGELAADIDPPATTNSAASKIRNDT